MTKARDLADGANAFDVVSATELEYLNGVSSAIQTQIDGKQAVNAAVSTTELGYLDGVTSAIQTQLDAKTAKSTLTTTGDIYYASSANTPARLGIGSTSQVLTVSGGVPSWATPAAGGGMTLLSTTDLTGGETVTISSINQSYTDLQIEIFNVNMQYSVTYMAIEPNSTNNITQNQYVANSTAGVDFNSRLFLNRNGNLVDSQTTNAWTVRISNYASTTGRKPFSVEGAWWNGNTDTWRAIINGGIINTTSAITALKFVNQSGDFSAGKVLIYGVK